MGIPTSLDGKPKKLKLDKPEICPNCGSVVEFIIEYDRNVGKLKCPICDEEVRSSNTSKPKK